MKPGTTYAYLAWLFRFGYTMDTIANRVQCERWEVERAIRTIMVREAQTRR